MYLNHRNNVSRQKVVQGIHGKQSVKELIGQNQGVSRMPIGDASIREFEREARKYGVDFAVILCLIKEVVSDKWVTSMLPFWLDLCGSQ